MGGTPQQHGKSNGKYKPDERRGNAQQHAEPLLPNVKVDLLELFVQVMTLVFDQRFLLNQKGIGAFAASTCQGQCNSRRINARTCPTASFPTFQHLSHELPSSVR